MNSKRTTITSEPRKSPLMRDSDLLRKAINGTFGVDINISSLITSKLTEIIDLEVLKNYYVRYGNQD